MRHSSRLTRILAVLLFVPTMAGAAGAAGHGPGVGSARGLSPVRPVVGLARGSSPVRPVVGSARALSPLRFGAGGPRAVGPRHLFRERNFVGGYGDLGLAGPGLNGGGFGDGYGDGSYASPPDASPAEFEGSPQVLLAPPPPCVRPQIIEIGRSVHVDRQAKKRAGVRVVYGRPQQCGGY